MDAAWKYEQNKKKIMKIGQELTESYIHLKSEKQLKK